ncbi:Bacteriophage TerL protein [Cupriavidus phytorum]|uniref:Bacteriophage TerL protein n=1 Tax=Cupriavidus taiwanensis TaxID=164546 RepID=A0A375C8Q5_9BURK|nr:TerL protein [Cupriavidus taiwanensis]SOY65600.1 Bacteriophage TerL protein [Cupriavidus taiwanensis]
MAAPEWFDFKHPDYERIYALRAERLERIRATPGMLDGLRAHYKDNPVDFINDWGMTFDPRNAEIGLPTVIPFLLFPKQADFITWTVERWKGRQDGLAEKSRDMGVSWLCVAVAVWMWLFWPGTVVGFGSRKEEYVDKIGDPKSLFWKARQFIALLPAEFRPDGWNEAKCAPHMRIINPENGAAIVGEAGDNIGRGNRTSIYFKDESAFYEHPEAIDAALSQTSNCKIDVSTPNGNGNPFYKKRHGGKVPVFTFHWQQDPRKGPEWYAKQKETLDAVIVAQEVDIDYDASVTDAWIEGAIVTAAMQRGPADVKAVGGLRVGVDVARFGDDKTVITFRRGRVLIKQVVADKLSTTQVAAKVKVEIDAFRETPEQIAVDTIGVGAGVADQLRAFYECVQDVNSSIRLSDGKNYNMRAYMWREMKDWIAAGASLPNDGDLKAELSALRYSFRGGEMLIESKDEAKKRGIKSPDRADSLALTFAFPAAMYVSAAPIVGALPDNDGLYF